MKDRCVADILAGLPLFWVRLRADVQTQAVGRRHHFGWAPLILIAGSTAPAAAAAVTLQPGLYELTTTTADGSLPSVTRTCFSPTYALGDFARPQVDASCRTVHDHVAEGRIRIATRCGTAARRSVQTVDGRYSATWFETVTRVSGRGGGSPRSITFRTTGHRLRRFCIPTF